MTITEGSRMGPLSALAEGAAATLFTARTDPKAARKHWISSMKPQGIIVVDRGAAKALGSGKSLLPAGVSDVRGSFMRGDPVDIHCADGTHLGAGLSRYTADEARAIKGKRSDQIEPLLGYPGRAALIHRDDMAL